MDDAHEGQPVAGHQDGWAAPARLLLLDQATLCEAAITDQGQGGLHTSHAVVLLPRGSVVTRRRMQISQYNYGVAAVSCPIRVSVSEIETVPSRALLRGLSPRARPARSPTPARARAEISLLSTRSLQKKTVESHVKKTTLNGMHNGSVAAGPTDPCSCRAEFDFSLRESRRRACCMRTTPCGRTVDSMVVPERHRGEALRGRAPRAARAWAAAGSVCDPSAGDEHEEVGVVDVVRHEDLQGPVALRRVERAVTVKVDPLHRILHAAGRAAVCWRRLGEEVVHAPQQRAHHGQAGGGVIARVRLPRAVADVTLHSGLRVLLVQRRGPVGGGEVAALEATVQLTRADVELCHPPDEHRDAEDAQHAADMHTGAQKPTGQRRRAAGLRQLECLGERWPHAVRHAACRGPEQRVGEERVCGVHGHVGACGRGSYCDDGPQAARQCQQHRRAGCDAAESLQEHGDDPDHCRALEDEVTRGSCRLGHGGRRLHVVGQR